jgi:hypothetical protein
MAKKSLRTVEPKPVSPPVQPGSACELPVKMRLEGLPQDVETVADLLRKTGCVVEESRDYANRGKSQLVRRYITIKL